jgi:cyanate permease
MRRANVVAFALLAIALAAATVIGIQSADLGWSAALLAFAMFEHMNYYRWQLMYDTGRDLRAVWRRKRLRKAALAADLRRASTARDGRMLVQDGRRSGE